MHNDVAARFSAKVDGMVLSLAHEVGETCIAISAPSGGGKSHLLAMMIARPEFQAFEDEEGLVRPLLVVQAPSPCTSKQLAAQIYFLLSGEALPSTLKEHEAWRRARRMLQGHNTSILVIDEFHHALIRKTSEQTRSLVETIKNLCLPALDPGNTHDTNRAIGVVLAGTRLLGDIIMKDVQLRDRTIKISIKPLKSQGEDLKKFKKFLELLQSKLPFTNHTTLTEDGMVARMHKACSGYTGRATRLIKSAALMALRANQDCIDGKQHLAVVFADLLKLGPKNNPFLVADITTCPDVPDSAWDEATMLRGAADTDF